MALPLATHASVARAEISAGGIGRISGGDRAIGRRQRNPRKRSNGQTFNPPAPAAEPGICKVAETLNACNVPTPEGGKGHATQVFRLRKRLQQAAISNDI